MNTFAEVFGRFMQRSRYSAGQLQSLSGIRKRTIANWLDGTTLKPQKWQSLLKVAAALHLSATETSQLLHAARHQSLGELLASLPATEGDDLALFAAWRRAVSKAPLVRPRRLGAFIGRNHEKTWLLDHLQSGKVVTLCAAGGMGKTSLANEISWLLTPDNLPAEKFPDGIFFYSFYKQARVHRALSDLAHAFGEDPTLTTPRVAADMALSGKRALLIWDGAEEADDLASVLEVGADCAILVTTRRRSDAPDVRLDLEPFRLNDAVALLRHISQRPNMNQQIAETLCLLVGCLPLSVHLMGHHIESHAMEPDTFRHWLEETPLEALDHGQRRMQSVAILLEKSVQQLGPQAQELLALLGGLALQPVSAEWFGSNGRQIGALVNWGMMVRDGNQFQLRHPLIHHYAETRMVIHSAELSKLITSIEKHVAPSTAASHIEKIYLHVPRLVASLKQHALARETLLLTEALHQSLFDTGRLYERKALLSAAIEAARFSNSVVQQAALHERLGETLFNDDEMSAALEAFETSLTHVEASEEPADIARLHGRIGRTYLRLNNPDVALVHYQLAYALSQGAEQRFGLAAAHVQLGNYAESQTQADLALNMARAEGKRRLQAKTLDLLSLISYRVGTMSEAIELVEASLAILRAQKDTRDIASKLSWLGHLFLMIGSYDKNHACQSELLRFSQEYRFRSGEITALANLGHNQLYQGFPQRALHYYQQSFDIGKPIKSQTEQNVLRGMLSYCHAMLGEGKPSLAWAKESMMHAHRSESEPEIGRALHYLARAQMVSKKLDEAAQSQLHGLEIVARYDEQRLVGHNLALLAEIFEKQGKHAQSLEQYRLASISLQTTQQRVAEMWCVEKYAALLAMLGNREQAIEQYQRCIQLAHELKDKKRLRTFQQALTSLELLS